MRRGGTGGASTLTGLIFEAQNDFYEYLTNLNGYELRRNDNAKGKSRFEDIYYNNHLVGHLFQKHGLYHFIESKGIDWKDVWSSRLLPDEGLFVLVNNKVYIVEKKYQEVPGSVDEKLQTADFKLKKYQKLFNLLNYEVEYIYLLNDWFEQKRYKDSIDYVKSIKGCSCYINKIPFEIFGLPIPGED